MNCKDCKFWSVEPVNSGRNFLGMGSCNNELLHKGYGEPDNKAIRERGAIIEDDEGWGWYVAPMFGCIHFKQAHE